MSATIISLPRPRATAFFDGQNLFHSVKKAFGYSYPNYDAKLLAQTICDIKDWELTQTRLYTGIHSHTENPLWHHFWSTKIGIFNKRKNTFTYTRQLRYLDKEIRLPSGASEIVRVADEKGIDVRIAIDAITAAFRGDCDVILLFSQDQDLSEVATKIRTINKAQGKFIRIASAYPKNRSRPHLNRGVDKTDWIPFDRDLYDPCIDPRDYFPPRP